jgi:hypothetical protein
MPHLWMDSQIAMRGGPPTVHIYTQWNLTPHAILVATVRSATGREEISSFFSVCAARSF